MHIGYCVRYYKSEIVWSVGTIIPFGKAYITTKYICFPIMVLFCCIVFSYSYVVLSCSLNIFVFYLWNVQCDGLSLIRCLARDLLCEARRRLLTLPGQLS